jgi:transcription elongation factor SPT6
LQLRDVPIQSVLEHSSELDDEAEWIYKQAFLKPTISNIQLEGPSNYSRKPASTIGKIKKALDFIRNQHLEVPFIAFYRKEYVLQELKIKDLWKVYKFDAKWCILQTRKKALLKFFEQIRDYQLELIADSTEEEKDGIPAEIKIPEDMRVIRDEDIERLRSVQTPEELRDVHDHFLLYCAPDIEKWKSIESQRKHEKQTKVRDEKLRERKEVLQVCDFLN